MSTAGKDQVLERYLSMVNIHSGCWLWTGRTNSQGYGLAPVAGQVADLSPTIHRAFYQLLVGPIPDGLVLDHTCHTEAALAGECQGGDACVHRRCVNPAHLEPVTIAENCSRVPPHLRRTGHSGKTHCKRGHEFTPENTYVWKNGWRHCRECRRINSRDSLTRRRATS